MSLFFAVICGAEGWQDVENYGKAKIAYLKCYLDYKNGIPSDDTIRRFFRAVNPEHFKQIFSSWVQGIANVAEAKVIAIDGKSNRRTFDGDENMLHVVSAFATEARVVLGQEKVADKSNEITAIPRLLDLLDLKGHIVTIDAMGCQYAIANKIVAKEGDYIFSLKGNQGSLSEDVKLYFNGPRLEKTVLSSMDYDKGHGRIETRECLVCNEVQWLRDMHPNWTSIQSIIRINSKREFINSDGFSRILMLNQLPSTDQVKKDILYLIMHNKKITTYWHKNEHPIIKELREHQHTELIHYFSSGKSVTQEEPDFKKIASLSGYANKTTEESRYYVSSLSNTDPQVALKAIRDHWGIENTLHWVLDMSFNEDYSRIRKENAPQVMAMIRHIALNLLQQCKPKRQSIKGFRKICSWDDTALTELVSRRVTS